MGDSGGRISAETVLAVFEERANRGEPLSTSEIAEAVGCSPRTVEARLESLSDRGVVESNAIAGQARVWWRPSPVEDRGTVPSPPDDRTTPSLCSEDSRLLECILEASPISIVVVEPSGEISFANGRAEETLGLDRDEITSRTYREPEWNIFHPDGTPITEDEHPVTRVLETGEPDFGFEHWIENPDGTERWLSSNSAPVLNDEGEIEFVVVGFEDATLLKEREDKLTSDQRRLFEFRSDQLFEPFLDAADNGVRIDVDEVVELPDGRNVLYLTATGISAKALTTVFERHYPATDVRLLRSTEDYSRIEVHVDGPTVPVVFEDLGGRVTSLVRCRGDDPPVLTGELPGNVDPRTAIEAIRPIYSDVELGSQKLRYSPRLLLAIVEDALTDRQFATLRTAYFGGYFDIPRTSTGDELAERLGITRQTFNQHLRKAERIVFEQLFEASGKRGR